jgi:sugar lactone lactonase YvrE
MHHACPRLSALLLVALAGCADDAPAAARDAAASSLARCYPYPATGAAPAISQRATAPPTDTAGWSPPAAPPYEGVLAINAALEGPERLGAALAQPEDVVIDAGGAVHTGTSDGIVWRATLGADGALSPFTPLATTPGRPLGMAVDPCGNLVVAVAGRGLVAVDAAGEALLLADRVDGTLIEFADEVAVAADGTIYVSDASTRYARAFPDDFLEGRPHGRLLAYEPATGAVRVVVAELYFANGVVLAPDESHALVAESFRGRIARHWLAGPRAGTTDVFADNLPVSPDNLTRAGDGRVWVTGVRRTAALDALSASAELRLAILRGEVPAPALPDDPHAIVVVLDADGALVQSLHGQDPALPPPSSAVPHGDHLYLATNVGMGLSRVVLPR